MRTPQDTDQSHPQPWQPRPHHHDGDPVHAALCGITAADVATARRVHNWLRARVEAELLADLARVAEGAPDRARRCCWRDAERRHDDLHGVDYLLWRYQSQVPTASRTPPEPPKPNRQAGRAQPRYVCERSMRDAAGYHLYLRESGRRIGSLWQTHSGWAYRAQGADTVRCDDHDLPNALLALIAEWESRQQEGAG